jgi:glycosyltransferase involved in cell wall biosynthesis
MFYNCEMNITFLIYGSLDTVSGGYIYDRKIVEFLRENGDQVTVVSIPNKAYLLNVTDNCSNILRDKLINLHTDILIQDELCHPSLFMMNKLISPKIKYPIVSIIHHFRSNEPRSSIANWLYRSIENLYLKSLNGYIFNCATTRNKASEISVSLKKYSTIAYPAGDRFSPMIDLEHIKRKTLSTQPFKVVFLGNIIRRKGLHVLLNSLSKIPKNLWELTIIGRQDAEIDYARSIHKQIDELHLNENVKLLGKASDEEIKSTLNSSHILCMPSLYEGYGIVYLEGMSFGLPSIASNSGGAVEIITHKENGILVNPNSVDELEAAINSLIYDREYLLRMSFAALERYRHHPTWEDAGRIIQTFLHENYTSMRQK